MKKSMFLFFLAAFLMNCSSSSSDQSESANEDLVPLAKLEGNSSLLEELQGNVTSKRRGKLNRLEADGQAWFSFTISSSFEELKISVSNTKSLTDFIWPISDILDSPGLTQQQNITVDVVIGAENVEFLFNQSVRFSYPQSLVATDNSLNVSLDGEDVEVPGILYDLEL